MFGVAATYKRLCSTVAVIFCAAALLIVFSFQAAADEANKKTVITSNVPLELPGRVLPAGTYVFKLLDTAADRNIVQVFDKDEKQLYATVIGIPDYHLTTPDKPLILFDERPSDSPQAIRAWFYPGDNYGVQFVYPQERALALAKRNHQNVLSMRNEMTQNLTTPSKSAADPSVRAMKKAEVTAVDPSGQQTAISTVVASKPK
ncbi:MAG: hypothetical protein QOJ99_2778 [Bryobacterales bacterium]|nr:hypothetical protein [Bryobacterales bacterium]